MFILLAERDPFSAELTEHFLRSEGYDVKLEFDPDEALAIAIKHPPNLAIVDMLIAGAKGQRLCSQLLERTARPVVAISSLASADAAFAVGVSAFLQKPIEPLQLIATIHELLGTEASTTGQSDND